MRVFRTLALAVLLCASAFAADEYQIDAAHSTIGFSVRHMMVTNVPGRFTQFSGTITLDEKDMSKSSVNVTIKAASINTDNQRRDDHLRNPDFFDVEKYPDITFVSKRVEKRGEGQYVAYGTFTMKGVSKEIELPFTLNGPVKMGQTKRIGIESETRINRREYGVAYSRLMEGGGAVVADEVKVRLDIEAVQRTAQPAAQQAKPAETPAQPVKK